MESDHSLSRKLWCDHFNAVSSEDAGYFNSQYNM